MVPEVGLHPTASNFKKPEINSNLEEIERVRLNGNLQILKDGVRPAFSLDSEKVTELLEGKNLYTKHKGSQRTGV